FQRFFPGLLFGSDSLMGQFLHLGVVAGNKVGALDKFGARLLGCVAASVRMYVQFQRVALDVLDLLPAVPRERAGHIVLVLDRDSIDSRRSFVRPNDLSIKTNVMADPHVERRRGTRGR